MSPTDQRSGSPAGQERISLGPEERFKIEYDTVNSYILHYSNVRSALASFLITVALAAFGGYYSTQGESHVSQSSFLGVTGGPHILWVAGYLFLLAAVVSSLYFSYLTERTTEYSIRLWIWGVLNRTLHYPGGFRGPWVDEKGTILAGGKRRLMIWKRVFKDLMNWLLVVGALGLGLTFYLFEVGS